LMPPNSMRARRRASSGDTSRADKILDVLLDVEAEFLGQGGFEIAARREYTNQRAKAREHLTLPPTLRAKPRQSRLRAGSSLRPPRADAAAPRGSACSTSPACCCRSGPIRAR